MDASAVMALIYNEPGADLVRAHLHKGTISAVNYAEVITKLVERSLPLTEAIRLIAMLKLTIVDFTEARAVRSAMLRPLTRSAGLSFGDRVCLALGAELGADILTADRPWAAIGEAVGAKIVLIC